MKTILWCYDPVENHDKVYGCFLVENVVTKSSTWNYGTRYLFITVWGRRGSKLQHKIEEFGHSEHFITKCEEKQSKKKGYRAIDNDTTDPLEMDVIADVEKTFKKLIVVYKLTKI